jgi:predicted O-linked N-acetylglucosamine transferase (SPINDLY family)
VMIDTPHWSGGNTTLDALCAALPVVTLEGRYMRGRQTAAMLRILGVHELIAMDSEHYLDLARKVATDPVYRRELSTRIAATVPSLIDRREPIDALAIALERIAAE